MEKSRLLRWPLGGRACAPGRGSRRLRKCRQTLLCPATSAPTRHQAEGHPSPSDHSLQVVSSVAAARCQELTTGPAGHSFSLSSPDVPNAAFPPVAKLLQDTARSAYWWLLVQWPRDGATGASWVHPCQQGLGRTEATSGQCG